MDAVKFKHDRDEKLILAISPILLSLFYGVVVAVVHKEIPNYSITITRSVDHKISGESVSDSHIEGRALDIRIYDMPVGAAKKITTELNLLLADRFGAISFSDGAHRFAVLESDHIHLQIGIDISSDAITKLFMERILKHKAQ